MIFDSFSLSIKNNNELQPIWTYQVQARWRSEAWKSVAARAAPRNPPSGSFSPVPAWRGWWVNPWAGREDLHAPSHPDPSYAPPPKNREEKVFERAKESQAPFFPPSSTHLHNRDGTVGHGRPINGAHHDSSCSERTGPGQSSIHLLEEVHQRPWKRHKTTHLTLPCSMT